MKNVLVLLAHSNYDNSLSNKIITDHLKTHSSITVRNLSDVSENFKFGIEAEQFALSVADIIVLQFPFHWYSVPSIMKKWFDDVLTFGFAYGSGGDKLKGKKVVLSFTTGGTADSYTEGGMNNFTQEQLVAPLIQTIQFCGMELAGIVSSNGMIYIPDMMGDKDKVSAKADEHAEKLLKMLSDL